MNFVSIPVLMNVSTAVVIVSSALFRPFQLSQSSIPLIFSLFHQCHMSIGSMISVHSLFLLEYQLQVLGTVYICRKHNLKQKIARNLSTSKVALAGGLWDAGSSTTIGSSWMLSITVELKVLFFEPFQVLSTRSLLLPAFRLDSNGIKRIDYIIVYVR